MSDWQKQVVCRYFVLGSCKNGASCAYSHDPDLIPQSTGFQQVGEYVDGYYEDYVEDEAIDFSDGYPQEAADYGAGPADYGAGPADYEAGPADYVAGADDSGQHYPSDMYPIPGGYAPLGEEMLTGVDADGCMHSEDPGGGGNNELDLEVPHNTCFDHSCQIQGLSVGVNTMSLDACSDPNCLDNSQTLIEAQDFNPGTVYPTSPTYIVYTPVYQSPALSPAAGSLPPLMSPPPPLYPQPISIVTTTPGGVRGGLNNVVLSPGSTEIMSPGRTRIMSPGRTGNMSTGRAEIMSPGSAGIMTPVSGVILSPTGGSMRHEVNCMPKSCLSPPDTSLSPSDGTSLVPSTGTSLSPSIGTSISPSDTSISPSTGTSVSPSVSGTQTPLTSPQQSVINKVSPAINSKLNPETAEWSPTKKEIFMKAASVATDKAASSVKAKATASTATAKTAASITKSKATAKAASVGKGPTKSATLTTPTSLSTTKQQHQNETSLNTEAALHSTEAHENANALQSNTDLADNWKVPTNWAEAPAFVPKPFAKQEPSLSSSSSGVSSVNQQKRSSSTLQVMRSSVPPRNASDTNQQPDEDQQPKQRSWAQVVNSNIVKQQSVNLTVSEAESQLCPYFRVGECRYGDICMYIHGIMCDYCGQNILHPQHDNQRKAHLGECLQEHERDMELSFAVARSKEKTCGICMEIVLDKPKGEARFGILPSCNHCFCLPCIRKWRQAKQFEHKIIRACPECRQTSDFICPSRFWVETTEQKEQLLSEYKKNLGLKECKYFNKGSGECPFGNKCFYQHADKDGRVVDVGPPRKPQRRVNAEGNLSLVQRLLLYDFLEEREGQLVLPLDFVELFDLYSDSEDWSENEP